MTGLGAGLSFLFLLLYQIRPCYCNSVYILWGQCYAFCLAQHDGSSRSGIGTFKHSDSGETIWQDFTIKKCRRDRMCKWCLRGCERPRDDAYHNKTKCLAHCQDFRPRDNSLGQIECTTSCDFVHQIFLSKFGSCPLMLSQSSSTQQNINIETSASSSSSLFSTSSTSDVMKYDYKRGNDNSDNNNRGSTGIYEDDEESDENGDSFYNDIDGSGSGMGQEHQVEDYRNKCENECERDVECPFMMKCCPKPSTSTGTRGNKAGGGSCGKKCLKPDGWQSLPPMPNRVTFTAKRDGSTLVEWKSMVDGYSFQRVLYIIVWTCSYSHGARAVVTSRQRLKLKGYNEEDGIQPGQSCRFKLAAVNEYGAMGFSAPQEYTKKFLRPSKPRNLEKVGTKLHGNRKVDVTIQWQPPFYLDNLPIDQFLVYWSNLDTVSTRNRLMFNQSLNGDKLRYTIRGLQPGKVYFVQVRAVVRWKDKVMRGDPVSTYIETYPIPQSVGINEPVDPAPRREDLAESRSVVRRVDVSKPVFVQSRIQALITWKIYSDKSVLKYNLYWRPELCEGEGEADHRKTMKTHQHHRDRLGSGEGEASTDKQEFYLYNLLPRCLYQLSIHSVNFLGQADDGKTVRFQTPACMEIAGATAQLCPSAPLPPTPTKVFVRYKLSSSCMCQAIISWTLPPTPLSPPSQHNNNHRNNHNQQQEYYSNNKPVYQQNNHNKNNNQNRHNYHSSPNYHKNHNTRHQNNNDNNNDNNDNSRHYQKYPSNSNNPFINRNHKNNNNNNNDNNNRHNQHYSSNPRYKHNNNNNDNNHNINNNNRNHQQNRYHNSRLHNSRQEEIVLDSSRSSRLLHSSSTYSSRSSRSISSSSSSYSSVTSWNIIWGHSRPPSGSSSSSSSSSSGSSSRRLSSSASSSYYAATGVSSSSGEAVIYNMQPFHIRVPGKEKRACLTYLDSSQHYTAQVIAQTDGVRGEAIVVHFVTPDHLLNCYSGLGEEDGEDGDEGYLDLDNNDASDSTPDSVSVNCDNSNSVAGVARGTDCKTSSSSDNNNVNSGAKSIENKTQNCFWLYQHETRIALVVSVFIYFVLLK